MQMQTARTSTASSDDVTFGMVASAEVIPLLETAPKLIKMIDDSKPPGFAFADVVRDLATGKSQLWVGSMSGEPVICILTRIDVRPLEKVGMMVSCVGSQLQLHLRFLTRIESFFRAEGCKRSEAWVRKGYQRLLRNYQSTHILVERAL